eukprot:gnl/Trimastix_PCT/2025.p1 GENE.gnl/Trimastix_PCT/2025~~gnl/Trimastix_PCT/2025.p1  ORF type:complete len:285 (-),score=61.55 gnl/Trimastix_PCT/2025:227-1081(-)
MVPIHPMMKTFLRSGNKSDRSFMAFEEGKQIISSFCTFFLTILTPYREKFPRHHCDWEPIRYLVSHRRRMRVEANLPIRRSAHDVYAVMRAYDEEATELRDHMSELIKMANERTTPVDLAEVRATLETYAALEIECKKRKRGLEQGHHDPDYDTFVEASRATPAEIARHPLLRRLAAEAEGECGEDAEGEDEDADLVIEKEHVSTICPITKARLVDPVRNTRCRHVYSRSAINSLLGTRSGHIACPVVGCTGQVDRHSLEDAPDALPDDDDEEASDAEREVVDV